MDATQQTDHDNIITLIANVRTLTEEVRLMRDGTAADLKDLKTNKLDRSEFIEYRATQDSIRKEKIEDMQEQIDAANKKADFATKMIYIAIGALGILEFVIPLAVHYYLGA